MQKNNITEALINEYTKIAYYYHKAGFTQEEIANKMNMYKFHGIAMVGGKKVSEATFSAIMS